MGRHTYPIGHLERSHEDNALRRAIGARLDRALNRAGMSSAKAAKRLSVSENDVLYWRRGIRFRPCTPLRVWLPSLTSTFIGFARAKLRLITLRFCECRKAEPGDRKGAARSMRPSNIS